MKHEPQITADVRAPRLHLSVPSNLPDAGTFRDAKNVWKNGDEQEAALPGTDVSIDVYLEAEVDDDPQSAGLWHRKIYGAVIHGNWFDRASFEAFIGKAEWQAFEADLWNTYTERHSRFAH